MVDAIQNSSLVGVLSPSHHKPTRSQQVNKLYALPAPLRTFPLPTLVPHNPLSLFQILYVWLSQSISPPSSHFEPLYRGLWSPDTRSVHITDDRSIQGLWEQGFFGKGTLSRSEPNWMKGQIARANRSKATSEELTKQRREERQQAKWERARKEREAIDQKLLEEAGVLLKKEIISKSDSTSTLEQALFEGSNGSTASKSGANHWAQSLEFFPSPVGPIELLSLPNSISDLEKRAYDDVPRNLPDSFQGVIINRTPTSFAYTELSRYKNQDAENTKSHTITNNSLPMHNGVGHDAVHIDSDDFRVGNELLSNGHSKGLKSQINGITTNNLGDATRGLVKSEDTTHTSVLGTPTESALANGNSGSPTRPRSKSQKCVRFSPNVEKNTFIQSEPPSPDQGVAPFTNNSTTIEVKEEKFIQQQEHFQLMMEEAFFLSYGLGALLILDPVTNSPIPNQDLFSLFRKASHFPPLSNPVLAPDDTFLVNYVVYHHYRSLGWCVRGGAKFSCDFLLYHRGPVFSHAEFAILIVPSYTDPYWSSDPFLQNYVRGKEKRSWSWMHCINRVIGQVKKKLILVYVDIPRPMDIGGRTQLGVDEVLGRYKVREFVMRRWLSNRERG